MCDDVLELLNVNIWHENIEKKSKQLIQILEKYHDDIIEYIFYQIEDYVKNYAINFCEEKFENMMEYDVITIIKEHIRHLYIHFKEESIKNNTSSEIILLINETGILYNEILDYAAEYYLCHAYPTIYSVIIPRRSYKKNGVRELPNIKDIKDKIIFVENCYQPEQRTEEWYEFRHSLISASDIGKIFSTPSSLNQLILKKCEPYKVYSGGKTNLNSPLHWGQKYEPVTVLLYEDKYDTKVGEFGCIRSTDVSCIGASPDGINIKETSLIYGRMLEIKNVVSREINGIPKKDYWIQMQIQMMVCNLKECDFCETKFLEYNDYEEFKNDGTLFETADGNKKGIILQFEILDNPVYEYKPINMDDEEFIKWKEICIEKHGKENFIKEIYWKVVVFSCVLVRKNNFWIESAIPKIKDVWDIIEKERVTGYEHRIPEKRKKKAIEIDECMIDIDDNDNILNKDIQPEEQFQTNINKINGFEIKVRTKSFDETKKEMDNELENFQIK